MNLLQLPFWDFFKWIWKDLLSFTIFDTFEYWSCAIILLLILFVIVVFASIIYLAIYDYFDKKSSTKKDLSGILIDKKYIGEQSSSGTGTAIIPNTSGGVGIGIVSTSSHSDEEFLLFVKADKVYKIEVDMQQYYSKNINEKIKFEVTIGGLSHSQLDIQYIS